MSAGAVATLLVGVSAEALFIGTARLPMIAWLLLPYLLTLFCAWWWIGDGVWRAFALLIGSLGVTGVGLYYLGQAWFFSPPEVASVLLQRAPWIQLALVAAMLALAFVPGMLVHRGVDRLLSDPAANDPSKPARSIPQDPASTHDNAA